MHIAHVNIEGVLLLQHLEQLVLHVALRDVGVRASLLHLGESDG